MKLPEAFADKMKSLLGIEYNRFEESFDMPRYYGLRVNTLKLAADEFLKISPFELEPVPWSSDGFYYKTGETPGRHAYYHAGLYYIQEPSAMLPAEVLDAKPGERVLDLCAAPGGKTVRIAAAMQGKGLLVANDINADRIKALVKNIELCGVRNAVVTNTSPAVLAQRFKGYFDRILIDAPCSGEGMFRKDEDAVKSWGKYKCESCSVIQREIMGHAALMLKDGGTMVYSTCTFSPEEDELIISDLLDKHPEFEIEEIPKCCGMQSGRPEWAGGREELSGTARLWPHHIKGEGHFTARMVKKPAERQAAKIPGNVPVNSPPPEFSAFAKENLNFEITGNFGLMGRNLYLMPEEMPELSGIKVSKFGWYLGEIDRGRFEPSHSLVIALKKNEIRNTLDFGPESDELKRYLRGETLVSGGIKGFYAVCVNGYTVGWAKQTGDMLKNLYPKGWRKMS